MKKRSLISIICALLSVMIFAVIVNLTFFGYNFLNILISKYQVQKITKETILNHHLLGDIFSATLNDSLKKKYPKENVPPERLVKSEDVGEFLKLALPDEIVTRLSEGLITDIYDFLDSREAYPGIRMDIRALKKNIEDNLDDIMNQAFAVLPVCTPPEQELFLEMIANEAAHVAGGMNYEKMPTCRPQEPLLTSVKQIAAAKLLNHIEKMDDELDFKNIINPEDGLSGACMKCHHHGRYKKDPHLSVITKCKSYFNNAKKWINFIWVIPMCFLLFGIFFGASGFKSLFRWLGAPLILSGLLSCFIIFRLSGNEALFQPELFCGAAFSTCPSYAMVSAFSYSLFNIVNPFLHLFAIVQLAVGILFLILAGRMKS